MLDGDPVYIGLSILVPIVTLILIAYGMTGTAVLFAFSSLLVGRVLS